MSNEIDWSKAPEGATHWVGGGWPWHKHIGDIAWYWSEDQQDWRQLSVCASDVEDGYRKTIVKRPDQAWNGTGLPPVGTVCEVDYCEHWHQCEVIAHFQQRCGMVAAFTVRHDTGAKSLDAFGESAFRPIRTEAQIAAEEREMVVQEMQALDPRNMTLGMLARADFCRTLYDAGYRKTGEKK